MNAGSHILERQAAPLPLNEIAALSGLQILQGMFDGTLPIPPFSVTARIYPAELAEGRIVFEAEPSSAFLNPLGTIHGGWIAMLLDTAMGCAVHSKLKAGQVYTTTAMTVNYVRPLTVNSAPVRCEAVVTHSGRQVSSAEGKILDAKNRLIAHGVETCSILNVGRNSQE